MLKVKKLRPDAVLPSVSNPGEDLGYDLYSCEDVDIFPGQVVKVPTGIAAVYEDATTRPYGLLIQDRSSVGSNGVKVMGGVIDAGYRGELVVMLANLALPQYGLERIGDKTMYGIKLSATVEPYRVKKGDKIAQMIPVPVLTESLAELVEELPPSKRGARGFGSSGV